MCLGESDPHCYREENVCPVDYIEANMSDGLRYRGGNQQNVNQRGPINASEVVNAMVPRSRTLIMWTVLALLGLYFGGWANPPVEVSPESEMKYNMALTKADMIQGLNEARVERAEAQRDVHDTKGWFFQSETAAHKHAKSRLSSAVQKLKPLEEKRYAMILAAKHEVGVWSKYGVDETREAFWETFQDGKDFAKRMTFWDVMFSVGSRRDEDGAAFIVRWVLRILMNYTMGMFYTLVAFMFRLWTIVTSFTPNFASGVVFYCVAVFSALSVIGAFLLLLYSMCIGGVALLAKNAGAQRRRQGGYPQQQRYIPHVD